MRAVGPPSRLPEGLGADTVDDRAIGRSSVQAALLIRRSYWRDSPPSLSFLSEHRRRIARSHTKQLLPLGSLGAAARLNIPVSLILGTSSWPCSGSSVPRALSEHFEFISLFS